MLKKITISLVLFTVIIFAKPTVNVTVDRKNVDLRTPIRLTIQFNDFKDYPKYNLDLGSDFQVVGGPSQSSNFSWVNGKTTSTKKAIYQIVAKRKGNLTIPSLDFKYKGKNYKTNQINIQVSDRMHRNSSSANSKNIRKQRKNNNNSQIFIEPICKKTSVYLGESLVISYRLFTRVSIVNYNIPMVTSISGFMIDKQERVENPKVKMQTINGIEYKTADLFNLVLTPTEIGKLEIPMQKFRIELENAGGGDPFDSFFNFSRNKVINTIAPAKNISVLRLPNDEPKTFTGAVGNFQLSAKLSDSEIESNKAVTLQIIVVGEGNFKNFTFPKPKFHSQLQVFEPKMKENISVKNNKIVGNKTWEFVIIPEEKGHYKIPPIKFTYYDLRKKRYVTLTKSNLVLEVTQNKHLLEERMKNMTREEVELLNKDIRYLHLNEENLESKYYSAIKDFRNYLFFILGIILIFVYIIYSLYMSYILNNPLLIRRQKAFAVAENEINQLPDETVIAFKKISNIFNKYLADKLNLQSGELYLKEITEYYQNKKIDEKLLEKIELTWRNIEEKKFAPNLVSEKELDNIKVQIIDIMKKIEKIK
ncbi:MAG: BatD family protein [Candidatus Marinimicrobia bacterium]|nr:BatD family protein [Candidatus Neomarinimicrobiota bacterium]